MNDKPRTRLYVEDDLTAGGTVNAGKERAHYLAHVLRLGAGAPVALFNGRDGEWLARIESVAKKGAILSVETQRRAQTAESDIWLAFAPVKRGPLDFVVQKATELGASALLPVVTRRTVVDRVKRDRMLSIAIEAAEQCERLTVPLIEEATPLSQFLDCWPSERHILLCAEVGESVPIRDFLAQRDPGGPAAIFTGPEGGFDQSELDALRKLPFVSAVGLGPRILRADTAAIAALACWQAASGDWRERPPGRD